MECRLLRFPIGASRVARFDAEDPPLVANLNRPEEFLVGLARRITETIGTSDMPQVREQLGYLAARAGIVDGMLAGIEAAGAKKGPYWVPDRHFDIGYHVREIALPAPGTREQLLEQAGRIYSRRLDRARHAAQQFGAPRAYGSYEALLADPDVEAVYIPLPNHLHVEWSIKALEAGKHVLIEKPFANSAAEARRAATAVLRLGEWLGG